MQEKSHYVNEVAKEGVLVAFECFSQKEPTLKKVFSGMITTVLEDGFDVQTKNGKMYKVLKSQILWVKTSKRWPKEIYEMLRSEKLG